MRVQEVEIIMGTKIGFVTCVQLGLSCIEKIYSMEGQLDIVITLKDEKAQKKSGRIFLDEFAEDHDIPLLKINNINEDIVEKTIKEKELDWLFIIGDVYKRQSLGMATQMDILTAKKNVQSIQSTYTQTRTSLDSVKHSLCLATGWQFNADPDIREVPGADMNRIAAMNPDADKQTALQNNYDLNYNKKILKNMTEGSTDKKNMERTIKNLEETVAASMVNLYNDILQKKTAFELAEAALATETTAMNAMERKYQLGMASQLDYLQEQAAFLGKQIDRQTAEISLFLSLIHI